jgi:hypothetical protein
LEFQWLVLLLLLECLLKLGFGWVLLLGHFQLCLHYLVHQH